MEAEIKVLDHGFVRVVDKMGDDHAIAAAARCSTGKQETIDTKRDEQLIRYLIEHQHFSPVEMCELKLHVKLPIFVMRQWIRHRTANVNEFSMRYSEAPEEFYVPDIENICGQCSINKQGSGGPLPPGLAEHSREMIELHSIESFETYKILIGNGVSRETARMVLPVNWYTQMYWKIDLRNLFNFLKLRLDSHAQLEIRLYAQAISEIVKEWVPVAYKAFEDFVLKEK